MGQSKNKFTLNLNFQPAKYKRFNDYCTHSKKKTSLVTRICTSHSSQSYLI